MFGLSGDGLVDWAAAQIPFLQKEIPVWKTNQRAWIPVRRFGRSNGRVYARINQASGFAAMA
jgi:hypothetical protein